MKKNLDEFLFEKRREIEEINFEIKTYTNKKLKEIEKIENLIEIYQHPLMIFLENYLTIDTIVLICIPYLSRWCSIHKIFCLADSCDKYKNISKYSLLGLGQIQIQQFADETNEYWNNFYVLTSDHLTDQELFKQWNKIRYPIYKPKIETELILSNEYLYFHGKFGSGLRIQMNSFKILLIKR